MQWLLAFLQNLDHVYTSLSQNLDSINGLHTFFSTRSRRRRRNLQPDILYKLDSEILTSLAFWREQAKSSIKTHRILRLQARACCELVYNIINIKNNEVLQIHGQILNKMTEMARSDDRVLLALQEKAQSSSRSMQTLTFLSLLYLPPSFLAVRLPKCASQVILFLPSGSCRCTIARPFY
jgi:hypothetical protein